MKRHQKVVRKFHVNQKRNITYIVLSWVLRICNKNAMFSNELEETDTSKIPQVWSNELTFDTLLILTFSSKIPHEHFISYFLGEKNLKKVK